MPVRLSSFVGSTYYLARNLPFFFGAGERARVRSWGSCFEGDISHVGSLGTGSIQILFFLLALC